MITQSEREDVAAAPRREAGTRAKGEFRCSDCGYGVVTCRSLPLCPMFHGISWEPVPWRPFTRVRDQHRRGVEAGLKLFR